MGVPEPDGVIIKTAVTEVVIAREIFDRLRQATAADPAILAELCREYIGEARATIALLRNAVAEGNAVECRERAHYLKGSSLMIGARHLSQYCAILEQMGRDSDVTAAEPVLEQAAAALRAVEEELTRDLGPVALPAEGSAA
jgi:HPt (histidine-containing phosphotransfer) domain-containing protein